MQDQIAPVVTGSYDRLGEEIRHLGMSTNRIMVVGDTNTLPLYGEPVSGALRGVFSEVHTYAFPAGEEHKCLSTIEGLLRALMEAHFDRRDCIVALGGGVVGDMAGFAAAIYLRGIRVIQLPTTLLAQIDSSIGGKTAVDFDGYKNMVGAFHMPALVYTNAASLRTLPLKEFRAGMGEVVKSALLGERDFCYWLETHADEINDRDPDILLAMIKRTAGIKVDIVRRDPKEQGERALLNLGHTIGHAIEKAMDFRMLHGECVAVGTVAAAEISAGRGLLGAEEVAFIRSLLARFSLPLSCAGLDADEVFRITRSDKKMAGRQIRFVLLSDIGHAEVCEDLSDEELMKGIQGVLTEKP